MLAAILKDFNHLVLEEVPKPEPGPGEVLVRIKSCGFCATDYKAIKGIRRNVDFPLLPGHEPAGIITGVGAYVNNVKEGDEVILSPSGFCGYCRNCRIGNTLLRTLVFHWRRWNRRPAWKFCRVHGDVRERGLRQTQELEFRRGLPR